MSACFFVRHSRELCEHGCTGFQVAFWCRVDSRGPDQMRSRSTHEKGRFRGRHMANNCTVHGLRSVDVAHLRISSYNRLPRARFVVRQRLSHAADEFIRPCKRRRRCVLLPTEFGHLFSTISPRVPRGRWFVKKPVATPLSPVAEA